MDALGADPSGSVCDVAIVQSRFQSGDGLVRMIGDLDCNERSKGRLSHRYRYVESRESRASAFPPINFALWSGLRPESSM
jgi:hypothetical protein